jgi:hypothetical protein
MPKVRRLTPAIRRAVADELLRREFVAFVRRAFETVVPGEELHLNWHILAMRTFSSGSGRARSNA